MRLTTKIIIGIILSIFLLSILHIIGYSFSERRYYKSTYRIVKIPQENKTEINIEPYRVFVFEAEQSEMEGRYYCSLANSDNGLFIHQVTTPEDNNKLFFSEAMNGFISTKTNDDTLFLKINWEKVREQYGLIDDVNKKFKTTTRYNVPVSGVILDLRSSNVNIINKLDRLQTRISNLETDSIKIYAIGNITIDSCKASVIEPVTKQQLIISNCTAQVLNYDLDQLYKWKTESCTIEVTNFTGSKDANVWYDNKERGTINWHPKKEDGEISLTIKGETSLQIKQPPSQTP